MEKDEENKTKAVNGVVPGVLNDKGTKVQSVKKFIEDTISKMEDLATMEVMMPVESRVRERLKTIKELSSAKSLKIDGKWVTKAPKFHIFNLMAKKNGNAGAKITFSIYDVDKNGNKKLYEQKTEIVKDNGDKINRVTSAEYRIASEVTEYIEYRKPISREILTFDLVENN